MKLILNTTKLHSERLTLISESMGGYGEPSNHANHKYSVVTGIDRGNGYQGYMSISYFMLSSNVPTEAKEKVRAILEKEGLMYS